MHSVEVTIRRSGAFVERSCFVNFNTQLEVGWRLKEAATDFGRFGASGARLFACSPGLSSIAWTNEMARATFGFELETRPRLREFSKRAHRRALFRWLDDIARAIPSTWDVIVVNAELVEIRTAGRDPEANYYRDDDESWAHLVEGMDRLQRVAGLRLTNVHVHVGYGTRQSPLFDTASRRRRIARRLARVAKVFESSWRIAAGRGLKRTERSRSMEPYSWKALWSGAEAFDHSRVMNLSVRFPTLEVKLLGGLLSERGLLDLSRFAYDVRWVFGLLDAVTQCGPGLDLASLGLPCVGNTCPSRAHAQQFARLFLGESASVRSSFANRLAASIKDDGRRSADWQGYAARYQALGLEEVYEAHRVAKGFDSTIAESLTAPTRLRRLCRSLFACHRRTWLERRLEDLLPVPVAKEVRERIGLAPFVD